MHLLSTENVSVGSITKISTMHALRYAEMEYIWGTFNATMEMA